MKKLIVMAISLALFSCTKPDNTTGNGSSGGALYNFNGENPYGGLIISGNTLFGMTTTGGAYGHGIIYSVNINGTGFADMHDFAGAPSDGDYPYGELLLSGTTLYGMTHQGGTNSEGVLFSISTGGSGYAVLYNFGGTDAAGVYPNGSLIQSGNLLYGMTSEGGVPGNGNIFSFNPSDSVYTNIYGFKNGQGSLPGGTLVLSGGTFYGMAYLGGGSNNDGVVFSVSTTGTGYTPLVTFTGANGANPQGSLVLSNGVLYGTTSAGGANGQGNIFSVSASGSGFKDMYDFTTTGPSMPYSTLIISGSTLYGTASGGANGAGYVFSIGTNGSGFATVCSLGGADGAAPYSAVLLSNGILYGTCNSGGKYGFGTIYSCPQ